MLLYSLDFAAALSRAMRPVVRSARLLVCWCLCRWPVHLPSPLAGVCVAGQSTSIDMLVMLPPIKEAHLSV